MKSCKPKDTDTNRYRVVQKSKACAAHGCGWYMFAMRGKVVSFISVENCLENIPNCIYRRRSKDRTDFRVLNLTLNVGGAISCCFQLPSSSCDSHWPIISGISLSMMRLLLFSFPIPIRGTSITQLYLGHVTAELRQMIRVSELGAVSWSYPYAYTYIILRYVTVRVSRDLFWKIFTMHLLEAVKYFTLWVDLGLLRCHTKLFVQYN